MAEEHSGLRTIRNLKTKKVIIIAEDDKFYANIYKVKLSKEGYDVLVVPNGEELLQAARSHKPDLILLDLIMPVKDGFQTLQELKNDKDLQDINVIVMSNLSQSEDIDKAKQLGAVNYYVKTDISVQEMLDKVTEYLY